MVVMQYAFPGKGFLYDEVRVLTVSYQNVKSMKHLELGVEKPLKVHAIQ